MNPLLVEIVAIAIAGAALFCASYFLDRRYHGEPPVFLLGLFLSLVISFGMVLFYGFMYLHLNPFLLLVLAVSAFPAGYMTGRMVAGAGAHLFTALLYESKPATPMPSDFSLAKALEDRGDIAGALDTYWGYFHEFPRRPGALFAGAAVAEGARRYDEAVPFYEAIIDFFERDREVWADASLRLANAYANHFQDHAMADDLLTTVIARAPDLEQARIAETIMKRRTVVPH